MIPATWVPHRRADDDELLGYLQPVGDDAGRFRPVTVFGYALAGESDEADARQVLDSIGLSYLAGRWLLTLDGSPEPVAVEIVEAGPERLRLQNVDYSYEADFGKVFVLEVPPGDVLRRQ